MIHGVTSDRRPGRPRDARVDVAIADAARELLVEQGFGGATIEAIAARAGVGKAAIYRRWPNREALLFDVAAADVPDIRCPDTGSLRDDLVAVFTELAKQIVETTPAKMLGDILAEVGRNPELERYFKRIVAERRSVCGEVVRRLEEQGRLKDGIDADLVIDLISAPLFYKKLIAFDPADTAYVERVVDAVLGGVLRS